MESLHMNIIDELKEAADMADTIGEAGDGSLYIVAIAEIRRLKAALEEANGHCRAAKQIADREGERTNWSGFGKALEKSLLNQHKALYQDA